MKKTILYIQNKITKSTCPWHILWILFLGGYIGWSIITGDSNWMARFGGFMAFIGFLMTTISTYRKDENIWTTETSKDPFYKQGVFVTSIGTILWAFGDALFKCPVIWIHDIIVKFIK